MMNSRQIAEALQLRRAILLCQPRHQALSAPEFARGDAAQKGTGEIVALKTINKAK